MYHALHGEAGLERVPTVLALNERQTIYRRHHLVKGFTNKSRDAVFDDLGDRAAPIRELGCSAGQRLDQHDAKRLRPVIGAQHRRRLSEKITFFCIGDLSKEFHQWVV